jgi:hypothetical protein
MKSWCFALCQRFAKGLLQDFDQLNTVKQLPEDIPEEEICVYFNEFSELSQPYYSQSAYFSYSWSSPKGIARSLCHSRVASFTPQASVSALACPTRHMVSRSLPAAGQNVSGYMGGGIGPQLSFAYSRTRNRRLTVSGVLCRLWLHRCSK